MLRNVRCFLLRVPFELHRSNGTAVRRTRGLTFALSGAPAPTIIAEPRPLLARPLERGVGRRLHWKQKWKDLAIRHVRHHRQSHVALNLDIADPQRRREAQQAHDSDRMQTPVTYAANGAR